MDYDIENEMFRMAIDLVNQSSRNIFLTGRAGTGKTTFLKYIRENCSKQMAVVAPTGVAAINAGGVTIHSFFQLPFSPFIPIAGTFSQDEQGSTDRHSLVSRLRIHGDKKKVLQRLELLVIDEISMVRCDTMDAIDTVLRFVRKRPLDVFGGVQVLFIGDMYQLPPVIKEQEWKILAEYYDSQYFFDSLCIKEQPPVYIEFTKIYRQSEERFIRLLNRVRNNELDDDDVEILESRYQAVARNIKGEGYIILTTHNEKARMINTEELRNIDSKLYSYTAEIKDDFADNVFPAEEELQLKAGAQVMFIKNDLDKGKRYFNGKIGIVSGFGKDRIYVQCNDDSDVIEVKREKWESIRYTLNKDTRLLEEELLGSFNQFPLRLAWAITIHKSQGLTFEKAIIDAGNAFAPGQVYVALSRCTTLDGIILKSRIRNSNIFSDPRIVRFSQSGLSPSRMQQESEQSKKDFTGSVVLDLFDFSSLKNGSQELLDYLTEHHSSFNNEAKDWYQELVDRIGKIQETGLKFRPQLLNLLSKSWPADQNEELQKRIVAASVHFSREFDQIVQYCRQSPVVTDSAQHAKEYNDGIREVFAQVTSRIFLLNSCREGFDMERYQQQKTRFSLPAFSVNAYAGTPTVRKVSSHPGLYQELKKLRDSICSRRNLPVYIVAGSRSIEEMVEFLPQTLEQLEMVSGFGPAKIESYGQQFLDIIVQFAKENGLASSMQDKVHKKTARSGIVNKKDKKTDTKFESFLLFKQKKTIVEIAEARKLTAATIETHLAHYVESGDIEIYEVVDPDKVAVIERVVGELKGETLTRLREKLDNAYSFGEIRLVVAWKKFTDNRKVVS